MYGEAELTPPAQIPEHPMETVSIPNPVYPCALMNGFMPVTAIEKNVPRR